MIDMPDGDRRMFDGKWWAEEVIIAARAAEKAVHELDSMKPTAATDKAVAEVDIQQRWDSNAMRDLSDLRAENARLRDELEDFVRWSEAYPTHIFREPDYAKAHELLQAGGMTLDAISASIMRCATKMVGDRAKAALLQAGAAPRDGGELAAADDFWGPRVERHKDEFPSTHPKPRRDGGER